MRYSADSDAARVESLGLGAAQRYVPGGFFLGWLIENNSAGPAVSLEARAAFKKREQTGPAIFAGVGGVLDSRSVGPVLADFAADYIHRGDDGFFADMAEWFPVPTIFDVRDTWHNYEWLRIRLVERYSLWRAGGGA